MQIRTVFVMTHDSIGLGEDGPTHQPVEQLAGLRAVPHLAVYRPGDPVETAECWELILDTPRQAVLLALSRQPMPLLRREPAKENKSARGGYRGRGWRAQANYSEHRFGTASRGRSAGCSSEARHPDGGRLHAVPPVIRGTGCNTRRQFSERAARVAVEAAVEVGWERYIGLEGRFVGMHSFGGSGKIADVYKKFDISAEAVVRAARETLAEVAALWRRVRMSAFAVCRRRPFLRIGRRC
jgi:transketolase